MLFGFIYLGAAAYFVSGVVVPIWSNAAGQLVGFLAYDLVLIGPFLDHFGEASGGQEVSLIIYTAFVLYSAGLAVYYLFISPQTRFRLGVAASTDPGSTRLGSLPRARSQASAHPALPPRAPAARTPREQPSRDDW